MQIRTDLDAVITVTNEFTSGCGGLPVTGYSLVPLGGIGLALILTGAFPVLLSRRRSSAVLITIL